MTAILNLNDWRLAVVADGQQLYEEPAVALEESGAVGFGSAALERARMHPRQSNLEYLGRLSADPLTQPFQAARNHADLLYLHLQSLLEVAPQLKNPSLVIVPSTVSNEQLSLLLGVAQEAGIRIGGFADLAAVCLAARPTGSAVQFLELNMTSAYHCPVEVNTATNAGAATEYVETGIRRVIDGWTNVIADQFVSSSRFDPLHAAHTEQQLYSLVTSWFGTATPSSYLTIEHNGETRRQEVSIDALRQKLQVVLEAILTRLDPSVPVRLGPNASQVPLLRSLLDDRFQLDLSDADQIYTYLTSCAHNLVGDTVQYHRTLDVTEPPSSEADTAPQQQPVQASQPASSPGQATHGLHATTAYRIGSEALPASAVENTQVGGTVTVDGRLFTLIEVRD